MPPASESKRNTVQKFRVHAKDTGSSEVQIALLSERIKQLSGHFEAHQNDHGSRRGLLLMVSKRRRLLTYLKASDADRYRAVIQKLGIRR